MSNLIGCGFGRLVKCLRQISHWLVSVPRSERTGKVTKWISVLGYLSVRFEHFRKKDEAW